MSAPRALALVGATATGKTAIGEALAARAGWEIVCADSRQVYAELEIGTGKPTPAERGGRPHHLFEALPLGRTASAGWYARAAATACAEIHARGRAPLLVGGSGLYLRALIEGLAATPPGDPAVRDRIAREAESAAAPLYARLAAVDPETAARLAPRDTQRIVRALEVWETTGRTLSAWHRAPALPALAAEWRIVEVTAPADVLDRRIAQRTRAMFEQGLLAETEALCARGLEAALVRLAAVGYDEAIDLLHGRIDRQEAERRVDRRTRQLAKRQRTWFRHQIAATRIEALEPDDPAVIERVQEALASAGGPP